MTGQKAVVSVLGRLGHSISYNQVRLIETAQAELAQQMADRGYCLPLIPSSASDTVQTFFWWDNFDCKKENAAGSIHTTHGIEFQERDTQSVLRPTPEIQTSWRRTMEGTLAVLDQRKINPHKNPPGFSTVNTVFDGDQDEISTSRVRYSHGNYLRQHYSLITQSVPPFCWLGYSAA